MSHVESDERPHVVLASRSPRRKELLAAAIGEASLIVCPPSSDAEAGFEGLTDLNAIRTRLLEIVRAKHVNVSEQRRRVRDPADIRDEHEDWIIAADTIVVVSTSADGLLVLGQPRPDDWQREVRRWFHEFLSGRVHDVLTGVAISRGLRHVEFIAATQVTFDSVDSESLARYVATGESVGKAGGYAIQGAAAAFVRHVEGSLSNVIGLPVREVVDGLQQLGWRDPGPSNRG